VAAVLPRHRLGRRSDSRRADRRRRRLPPLERRRLTSHAPITPPFRSASASYERTLMALAITDEASPLALRSTRNRLRTAVRQGANWTAA
jgi:hypothetical protein